MAVGRARTRIFSSAMARDAALFQSDRQQGMGRHPTAISLPIHAEFLFVISDIASELSTKGSVHQIVIHPEP